ncbi:hypothetical protein [Marinobacter sp. C18]|uniref:hypothetical protein n=1 Tax=Marinobacter sp. C18 TaxID=1772288 RepID=UPI000AA71FC2|nr:hypothetical protein [Marinobacter sp. C18]
MTSTIAIPQMEGRPPKQYVELFAGEPMAETPVLLMFDETEPYWLTDVTIDPNPAQIAEHQNTGDDRQAAMTTLKDFAAGFWQFPDAQQAMSEQDWNTFTDFVRPGLADGDRLFRLTIPASLGAQLPMDLPSELVAMRLNVLDAYPMPQNLRTKIQLAELEMAATFVREPKSELFDPAQTTPSWQENLAKLTLETVRMKNSDTTFLIDQMAESITRADKSSESSSETDLHRLVTMRQFRAEGDVLLKEVERRESRANPFVDDLDLSDDEDDRLSMSN